MAHVHGRESRLSQLLTTNDIERQQLAQRGAELHSLEWATRVKELLATAGAIIGVVALGFLSFAALKKRS
jgi:hypothetical protein